MPQFSAVEFGPGRKDAFIEWITHELWQTLGDRQDLDNIWENYIIQWRAKLPDGELDFPYVGASNLELPLTAMHENPVYADMVQSFGAPADYWTPQAKRDDRVDSITAFREGLTALEKRYINMRRINGKAFLDNDILGSCVYKNGWRSERRFRTKYNADGTARRETVLISQPSITHIPLSRLYFPAYSWTTDMDAPGGVPWIAEEHRWSGEELDVWARGSAELPGFDKEEAEKARKHFISEDAPVEQVEREETNYEPFHDLKIRVYEVWCRFDTRGDGITEDFVATVTHEPKTLLRAIYFPNAHGKHPFYIGNYLPSQSIYGIGLAEIDEWAQEAGTKLLNAQIDNVLLSNTRMYTAPLGSQFQQSSTIYPSKVWYLGPDEQIGEVRMSDVYPSLPASLNQLMQLSELRDGVSDLRQGSLTGLPSRTPATSLLSILREGNKRFDMMHGNMRDIHSEMGLRMAQNVAQRAQENPLQWMGFFAKAIGDEDAEKVMQILLTDDVDSIEETFGVSVTATSAQVNKEVEKQSFIGMLQITQQIYQALVQTAMLMAQVPDPVVQETAKAAYASGVEMLARLFERFDVQNPRDHLGNLEAVTNALSAQGGGGNAATGGLQQDLGVLGAQGGPPQALDPAALASIFGL